MRMLYAIQGTGNGHISRARDVVPCLQQHGEVDILLSGIQSEVELPWPVTYRFYGLSFIFGQKGGVDLRATFRRLRLWRLLRDMYRLPVHKYDLVITDFEPISAWACRFRAKKCFGMSHQAAFLSTHTPRPAYARDWLAGAILKHYAPVNDYIGFHFKAYDIKITTPVIRQEVRQLQPVHTGPILVYLPACSDEMLLTHFRQLPEYRWQLFSKHSKTTYHQGNILVTPIDNEAYLRALANCSALLTGGGFEAPAEALFLGKKIMLVPMKGQYEQHANAEAAAQLGAEVVREIKAGFTAQLREWLLKPAPAVQHFPNNTQSVVDNAIALWHTPKNA
jgi:uncharacterized protein (TIGR00661 family)